MAVSNLSPISAILELENPVHFTKKIRPICLPRRDMNIYYTSAAGAVAGWGSLGLGGIDWASYLREKGVFIFDNNICKTQMHIQGQEAWKARGSNALSE